MDERNEVKGITFVWDADKAGSNLSKHGVSFIKATQVFFDPFLRVTDAGTGEEIRDAVIGMDERWNLLFVVHIEVEGDAIRIISARGANRSERHFYEY